MEACLTGVSTDFSGCLSLTVGVFGEGVAVEGDTTPSVDNGLASTTVMTGLQYEYTGAYTQVHITVTDDASAHQTQHYKSNFNLKSTNQHENSCTLRI